MSVTDWATESLELFRTKPPTVAARTSLAELRRGGGTRLLYPVARVRGTWPMTIGGYRSEFLVRSPMDVERARSANQEQPVMEFVLDGLDSESVVWDVGAYHGHYTVHAAQTGATVHAFEPVWESSQRLLANAECNGVADRILAWEIGLSDQHGVAQLSGPTPNQYQIRPAETGVPVRTGDDLIRTHGLEVPDVMKIDVEGHEVAVLDGIGSVLSEIERVAVEVHDGCVDAVRERLQETHLVWKMGTERSETHLVGVSE